jgi:hypothetical protein
MGESGADHPGVEPAVATDNSRDEFGRKHGVAVHKHEMEADTQGWQAPCDRDRMRRSRPRHHQARRT